VVKNSFFGLKISLRKNRKNKKVVCFSCGLGSGVSSGENLPAFCVENLGKIHIF
jgi:hypothetical protein